MKKTDAPEDSKKLKPIHLGKFTLDGPKQHTFAAIILNEKADESIVSHILPKNFDQRNISFNVNPNASLSLMQSKGRDEIPLEKKKSMLPNMRRPSLKGKNKDDKIVPEEEEYLTPFDFITLLRSDPDMADEFCYLNKRDDPYDWQIVDFDKRNPKEYMTISSRVFTIPH